MRLSYILLSLLTVGCQPMEVESVDAGNSNNSNDPTNYTGPRAAWVEIQTGYCSFQTSDDGGASWSASYYEDVSDPSRAVKLYGGADELIEVYCDASVTPRYGLPAVAIDPQAAPVVYCNPWGDSNKIGGEADDCFEDLWVYIYSSRDEYPNPSSLGPYNLN
ncbi:hypothetical protein HQ487_05095 [Candidatus Uhrbacteria bacterium]|nr:hypothetical protein [Candidatus Uhrbacteria bacterium]